MFRIGGWLAGSAVAMWAPAALAAPLETYGKLPNIEALAISPDGARLALILTDGEQRIIAISSLTTHKYENLVKAGQAKVREVRWAGPDHLIITSTQTTMADDVMAPRREWAMAVDYNLATQKIGQLLQDADSGMNVLLDVPKVRTVGGKPTLFVTGVHFAGGRGMRSLYRIDLDRDKSHLVEQGMENTRDWAIGPDGTLLAQSRYDIYSGRWSLMTKQNGSWREARSGQASVDPPFLVGLGRDGRSVAIEEFVDGAARLRETSLDGAVGEPLGPLEGGRPIFDPINRNLIGMTSLSGEDYRYSFFDAHDQKVWDAVAKAYPGQGVQLVSWSDDRQKIVVRVESPEEGPGYALVDMATRHGDWIGAEYTKLDPQDVAPVRTVRFKAQDGLSLGGYLTTPRGVEAKNLPLVVFPHGGPAARDLPGFDWWAQAMASRGYAVLQVNFRGSSGFGWDFLKAGFGEWGRKMQTDLSDGVRDLVAKGVVDPKRVCIVGASYGGYAALAGAALDAGVYRCAASYGGISDLPRMVRWSKGQNGAEAQRYWLRFMGADKVGDDGLKDISPALNAAKVQVPILLIHGKDDTVVPLEQSRYMADALKAAGKPVELLTLNSTDHWLSKGETRLAMLQAVVAFLEKNNPAH